GWEMPVQYSGVIDEHLAVRSRAGLFAVSHMGEVEVLGEGAFDFCQKLTPNDLARAKPGQAQYNLLLNERGGAVDDIVVYPLKPGAFFICVNASNTDKDFDWIRGHAPSDVPVENTSARYAQLALQGPAAEKILQPLTPTPLKDVKSFYFFFGDVGGIRSLVARTGYTGEDGFELFCEAEDAEKLWNALLDAGESDGLKPAGLGARDTLRLERALALYGLELIDPGIARAHYSVFAGGKRTGEVTSGTKSPTLGKAIAMSYVGSEHAAPGTEVEVEIRERRARARVVPLPFYRRPQ